MLGDLSLQANAEAPPAAGGAPAADTRQLTAEAAQYQQAAAEASHVDAVTPEMSGADRYVSTDPAVDCLFPQSDDP